MHVTRDHVWLNLPSRINNDILCPFLIKGTNLSFHRSGNIYILAHPSVFTGVKMKTVCPHCGKDFEVKKKDLTQVALSHRFFDNSLFFKTSGPKELEKFPDSAKTKKLSTISDNPLV